MLYSKEIDTLTTCSSLFATSTLIVRNFIVATR